MSRAVIDQPGSRIAIAGLLLALVLGFALRSQITPAKVQAQLQKAVSRLEKDFIVDFENAQINLSNWGLPWPRLEINRIRLSPKKNHCQSSQIFIDQIEIPLSWSALLFSRAVVDTVRAHQVELRIADLKNCLDLADGSAVQNKKSSFAAKALGREESQDKVSDIFQRRTSSQLKYIHIEQLKVVVKNQYQQPLIFRQLALKLDYNQEVLSQINYKSRIFAINDQKADVFYLVGDLNGHVKALEEKHIEAHLNLKGRMLDGDIQLYSQFNSVTQKVSYEISTAKVSAKAFLPLVKLKGYESIFEKWPIHFTFSLTGQTNLIGQSSLSLVKVQSFEVNGERTQIKVEPVDLELRDGIVQFKPFNIDVQRLPLNQFKNLTAFKNELNSFEDLGDIQARIEIYDKKHWKMNGSLLNTYLIFSNRGTRELQKIDSIQFKSTHQNDVHELTLSDFKLNSLAVDGSMTANYNSANQTADAQMNISGQLLHPKIWRQLTNVEQAAEIQMNWTYRKTADTRQHVTLTAPKVEFEGFQMNGINIDFIQAYANADDHSLVLTMKAKDVQVQVPELTYSTAQKLFSELTGLTSQRYEARQLNLNLKGSGWKAMSFDFDMGLINLEDKKSSQVKAKGYWKDDTTLVADSSVQNGNQFLRFDITKSEQDEIILTPVK